MCEFCEFGPIWPFGFGDKRTYRTKSTWRTQDTFFCDFCNFLNSNVHHPRRVRNFVCFLMTNDYANFDLDLRKRTQRRSTTIFNQKNMAGNVGHVRLKRSVERTCKFDNIVRNIEIFCFLLDFVLFLSLKTNYVQRLITAKLSDTTYIAVYLQNVNWRDLLINVHYLYAV